MNNKTPKLRFKGFTDAWEQRKLSDISDVRDGTHDSPMYQNQGHPFVTSKNVKEGYINFDDIQYISDEDFDAINKRSKVDVHDILMGMIGTIGNLALIRTEPDFAIKNVALIKDTKQISYLYLYHYLQTPNIELQLLAGLDGGTQKFVSLKNIRELNVSMPSKEEQLKLGDFFERLDNLITLHQRKLEKIKSLKKAYLDKMFPKKGKLYPELRFAGFTDAWEQCKFTDGISEIGDGLHGTPIYSDNGNVFFINGNNLVDGKIVIHSDTKTVDEKQQSICDKSLDENTILMSINGTIGNLAYYSGERIMLGKSAAYIKVSSFDKEFIYAYLQAPSVTDYFMGSLTGTTIKNLGLKAIREMDLFVPQDIVEQRKIGSLFRNFDKLITLHQHKLEKLRLNH